MPRLPGWPSNRDPRQALRVRVWLPFRCEFGDESEAEHEYFRALITVPQVGAIRASCTASGHESWETGELGTPVGRVTTLIDTLGLAESNTPLTFRVAAVVGNLMTASLHDDLLSELLTRGAAGCGELACLSWTDDQGLHIRGHSDGGLLLPACLTLLADWQAHPAAGTEFWASTRRSSEIERWLLLAQSARHGERQEAARQLARFDDPRAIDVLERLLVAESNLRAIAMESLIRAGSTESLPALVAAGDGSNSYNAALVNTALWSLWSDASLATRTQLRPLLGEDRRQLVDSLEQATASASVASELGGRQQQRVTAASITRTLMWTLLIASSIGLMAALRRRDLS